MRSVTWKRFPIKKLQLIPCFFHLWSEVTWIQICASLNHRKKMKSADSSKVYRKPRALYVALVSWEFGPGTPKATIVLHNNSRCSYHRWFARIYFSFQRFFSSRFVSRITLLLLLLCLYLVFWDRLELFFHLWVVFLLNQWFSDFFARWPPITVYNFLSTPWPIPTVTNTKKGCVKINLSTFSLKCTVKKYEAYWFTVASFAKVFTVVLLGFTTIVLCPTAWLIVSAATGFSAKITRFTNSLDLKKIH